MINIIVSTKRTSTATVPDAFKLTKPASTYIILLLAVLLGGCGPSGPNRYGLSGTVTFGGQPVPSGVLEFVPDNGLGNSGPGTSVRIKDGRYQTPPGKGTVGGPHIVTIYGYTGKHTPESPYGSSIFSGYQTKVDLPHEATTHNYDIPRK